MAEASLDDSRFTDEEEDVYRKDCRFGQRTIRNRGFVKEGIGKGIRIHLR